MNCATAKSWLLTAKASEPVPGRIGNHLKRCVVCARTQADLKNLEHITHSLSTPRKDTIARNELEKCLDQVPRVGPKPPQPVVSPLMKPSAARLHLQHYYWAAALAVFLLVSGWLLGRLTGSRAGALNLPVTLPEVVIKLQPVAESVTPIVVRVAGLASRMVKDNSSANRLDVLELLADELRGESFRLAGRGQIDEIGRLTTLHDRVLRGGLVVHVLQLPDGKEREAMIARLILKMRMIEAETVERKKNFPSTIKDRLQPLLTASREAMRNLEARQRIEAPTLTEPANPPVIDSLVTLVVRLSREETPLQAANTSADLAKVLAQATILISMTSEPEHASRMGDYLNTVMEHGVADNLDRAEEADNAGDHWLDINRIRQQTVEATRVLERNIDKAPPAAQKGLQQALDASTVGHDRASKSTGKGKGKGKNEDKGKGPPWMRPDGMSKDSKAKDPFKSKN